MFFKKKALVGKLRPRYRPQINPIPAQLTLLEPTLAKTIQNTSAEGERNKCKMVTSITESNSKIYEPKSYKEAINEPIL